MSKRKASGRVAAYLLATLLPGCVSHQEQYAKGLPQLHVGVTALRNGEPTIAASIADANLSQRPNDPAALLLRADAEAAMGENGPAASDYRRVMAVQPRSAAAALGLARLLTPTNPVAAESLLAPFALNGRGSAPVWNNLGVARDLLGRHAEAQAAYRRSIAADPSSGAAQANLARSLVMTSSGG